MDAIMRENGKGGNLLFKAQPLKTRRRTHTNYGWEYACVGIKKRWLEDNEPTKGEGV